MTEPGWEEIKRLAGKDPHRHAVILRGSHGMYRFDALRWRKYYEPSNEDEGPINDGWWDCEHRSGLHETAEGAEAEARSSLLWLRAEIS